jgi:hypothetical protein
VHSSTDAVTDADIHTDTDTDAVIGTGSHARRGDDAGALTRQPRLAK